MGLIESNIKGQQQRQAAAAAHVGRKQPGKNRRDIFGLIEPHIKGRQGHAEAAATQHTSGKRRGNQFVVPLQCSRSFTSAFAKALQPVPRTKKRAKKEGTRTKMHKQPYVTVPRSLGIFSGQQSSRYTTLPQFSRREARASAYQLRGTTGRNRRK